MKINGIINEAIIIELKLLFNNLTEIMEEIKLQIKRIIEKEYRDALKKGWLNSTVIVNKIWKLLVEKDLVYLSSPEAVYGCYENFDESEQK